MMKERCVEGESLYGTVSRVNETPDKVSQSTCSRAEQAALEVRSQPMGDVKRNESRYDSGDVPGYLRSFFSELSAVSKHA